MMSIHNWQNNGPVIIGGVGGSGTRVVAEIVRKLGFYLGSDLNVANDNLTYTLLFKRPRWYYVKQNNLDQIHRGLKILQNIMLRNQVFSLAQLIFLARAVISMACFGHNHYGDGKGKWAFQRLFRIIRKKIPQFSGHEYIGWGWKEPNSFLLLPHFSKCFENFRYIHTIRHGLDMAFSKNQQQLFNWGKLYGVKRPHSETEIPLTSLEYWIKANQWALRIGDQLGSKKFLVLRFESLCRDPGNEIQKLIYFLEVNPPKHVYESTLLVPRMPRSVGRYLDHDLSQFDPNFLSKLQDFGYSV